ncbi:MAG: hypothetical protein RLZ98_3162 [Pseudomonadota bacterium]|jgi:hypothetical protein
MISDMRTLLSSRTRRGLALGLVGVAAIFAAGAPSAQSSANPFAELGGAWRGTATVSLTNGKRERMGCRAYYRSGEAASQLGLAIRCASKTGFKIELRSSLQYQRGTVSGQWEERTFNATGKLQGSATANRIMMDISGGVSGTMSVALRKGGHTVLIATQGTGFSAVAINLSPG